MERRHAVGIGEAHAFQRDGAARDPERTRIGGLRDAGLGIQQVEHALARGKALLQARVEVGERLERPIREQHGGDEGEEGAGRQRALDHLPAAIEDQHRDEDAAERFHERRGNGAHAMLLEDEAEDALDQPGPVRSASKSSRL